VETDSGWPMLSPFVPARTVADMTDVIGDQLPTSFWVFVSRSNFLAAHNVAAVGQITSPSVVARITGKEEEYLAAIPNPDATGAVSQFGLSLLGRYWSEYNGELLRRQEFPGKPSRFGALFAFGDFQTCEKVAEKHHWDISEVREFKPLLVANWGRFDMSLVTLMNGVTARSNLPFSDMTLWRAYWSGSGEGAAWTMPSATNLGEMETFSSGEPVWEYLIDGSLKLA